MDHPQSARTRRSFLQGGLLASLALVASLGALPIPDVAAGKKTKRKPSSVQSRNQSQREMCETLGGGTLEAKPIGGGSWETTCHGGESGGRQCTNTAQSTVCVRPRTISDVPAHPLQPQSPFADPAVGATQPLEPDSPFAHPSDAHPLEPAGDGVTITAYDSGTVGQAEAHRRRRRRGHGKGRKR